MIHRELFVELWELNNYIVNESITRSQIISINTLNDYTYEMFYFIPSILGDDE